MKKSAVLLTVVGTLLLSANFAFADQENIEASMNCYNEDVKVISLEYIKEKSGNYELIINQSTQQYKYLYDWGNTLRYLGSGRLNAEAYTKTAQIVDNINTSVYLQQYDESNRIWVNVDNLSNTQNNNTYSYAMRAYILPIGFKYRTLSIHKATAGVTTESVSVYSSIVTTY